MQQYSQQLENYVNEMKVKLHESEAQRVKALQEHSKELNETKTALEMRLSSCTDELSMLNKPIV